MRGWIEQWSHHPRELHGAVSAMRREKESHAHMVSVQHTSTHRSRSPPPVSPPHPAQNRAPSAMVLGERHSNRRGKGACEQLKICVPRSSLNTAHSPAHLSPCMLAMHDITCTVHIPHCNPLLRPHCRACATPPATTERSNPRLTCPQLLQNPMTRRKNRSSNKELRNAERRGREAKPKTVEMMQQQQQQQNAGQDKAHLALPRSRSFHDSEEGSGHDCLRAWPSIAAA